MELKKLEASTQRKRLRMKLDCKNKMHLLAKKDPNTFWNWRQSNQHQNHSSKTTQHQKRKPSCVHWFFYAIIKQIYTHITLTMPTRNSQESVREKTTRFEINSNKMAMVETKFLFFFCDHHYSQSWK